LKRPPTPAEAPWDLPARWAVLALLALPLALFFPALLGGKMLWGADIQSLELVFKTAVQRGLARGEWPLWMPEILCGMPGIAASNLVFLHPLELLLCLLRFQPWMGFGLDAAAEVALSGLGLWLLLRQLGLGRGASLLGALAFAASGTQISLLYAGHINNLKGIAMIPWVFWGALWGWQGRHWLGWGLCGAALALQVLGLGLQIFAYTILGLGAFAAWLAWCEGGRRAWLRAFLGLSAAALFLVLLSAPQLFPSLQYKGYSWREAFSYDSFISWSFDPKESLAWIVPGFFGWREPTYHGSWPFCLTTEYFGLLPWALAFAAVAAWWADRSAPWAQRLRRPELFFVGLAVFSFLAGIGRYFPLHHLFFHLPIYNGFRTWTRFLCLMTFSVCVLAAFGWEALLDARSWTGAWKGALAFAALAFVAALAALAQAGPSLAASSGAIAQKLGSAGLAQALDLSRSSALRALALSGLLGAALLSWARLRTLGWVLLAGALCFHGLDVSEVAARYLDFRAPSSVIQPPPVLGLLPDPWAGEPYRVLDLPGLWTQNTAALFGYETVQGYHGVQMAAPMKLQTALAGRQMDWLNLLNGRYIISPNPLALPGFRTLNASAPFLYENPNALPRAFLAGSAQAVAGDDQAFQTLAQPGFDVLHKVTLDRDAGLDGRAPRGAVAWLARGRNHLSLRAQSERPALLVLSQTWYPSWHAKVDSVEAPLLKADGGALVAVRLDAGAHQVDLDDGAGLLQASGGLALLGLLGLWWLWRLERRQGEAR
jgi:hypothetical protein